MSSLTREQRIARADEIFDNIGFFDSAREDVDALEVARCDLIGWIEELEDAESGITRDEVARALREIADRLDSLLERAA